MTIVPVGMEVVGVMVALLTVWVGMEDHLVGGIVADLVVRVVSVSTGLLEVGLVEEAEVGIAATSNTTVVLVGTTSAKQNSLITSLTLLQRQCTRKGEVCDFGMFVILPSISPGTPCGFHYICKCHSGIEHYSIMPFFLL